MVKNAFLLNLSPMKIEKKVLDIRCFHVASQLFIVRPWQFFMETELEDMKTIPI